MQVQHTPCLQAEVAVACRQAADAGAVLLAQAAFSALDRLARADAKHGERLRLENLAALEASLRAVGLPAVPVYQALGEHVTSLKGQALARCADRHA